MYIDFWNDRTFLNKVARLVYVIFHTLFASVWFYFIPFVSILLSYQVPYSLEMRDEDAANLATPETLI